MANFPQQAYYFGMLYGRMAQVLPELGGDTEYFRIACSQHWAGIGQGITLLREKHLFSPEMDQEFQSLMFEIEVGYPTNPDDELNANWQAGYEQGRHGATTMIALSQWAEMHGVDPSYARKLARNHDIPAQKPGHDWLIPKGYIKPDRRRSSQRPSKEQHPASERSMTMIDYKALGDNELLRINGLVELAMGNNQDAMQELQEMTGTTFETLGDLTRITDAAEKHMSKAASRREELNLLQRMETSPFPVQLNPSKYVSSLAKDRREKGLTQEQLATSAQIDSDDELKLERLEKRISSLPEDALSRIADVLGITAEELVALDQEVFRL